MTPPQRTAKTEESILNWGILDERLKSLAALALDTKQLMQTHIEHQNEFERTYIASHIDVMNKASQALEKTVALENKVYAGSKEITQKIDAHSKRIEDVEERLKPIEELYKNTTKFLWAMGTAYVLSFLGFLWALLNHWIYIGKLP